MSFLVPTKRFNKLIDIDIELLKKLNIKTILLDVDNTISVPDIVSLFDGVSDWIARVKAQNIEILIVSNNYKGRVQPIANLIGADFAHLSLKPLTFRTRKFLKKYNINKAETLIIGDQIFSDILFANLFGIKSILLEPQTAEKNKLTLKLKRKLEQFLKDNWESNKIG